MTQVSLLNVLLYVVIHIELMGKLVMMVLLSLGVFQIALVLNLDSHVQEELRVQMMFV